MMIFKSEIWQDPNDKILIKPIIISACTIDIQEV